MSEELDAIIENAAAEPLKAEVDGQSVENHRLPDLIEAAKFLKKSAASRRPNSAIRIAKISGNSAV